MDLPFEPAIPLLGIYPEEPKTLIWKNIITPMFIAVLFIIAKKWKQPKCPSIDQWIKQLWGTYTMEYYSAIKIEESFTLCNSMDGPGEHYAKWNKPVRERQIPYDLTHMWNLNEKTELTSKTETDSDEQMTASWWGWGVRGWRDGTKGKKDSWTWTTVWWLRGGGRNKGSKW